MITICPVCKKEYDVLHPNSWAFRRRRTGEHQYYLCSWKCLREFDKRKERPDLKRAKITLEQKKKAVEIAMNGGSPLKYLADCGSDNPSGMWWTIKQDLKKADPRTYELLPKRITAGEAEKKPASVPGIPINLIERPQLEEVEMPDGVEYLDKIAEAEKESAPEKPARKPLQICAVRSRVDSGLKYKVNQEGEMVLTFDGGYHQYTKLEWIALSEEILAALCQMEVAK